MDIQNSVIRIESFIKGFKTYLGKILLHNIKPTLRKRVEIMNTKLFMCSCNGHSYTLALYCFQYTWINLKRNEQYLHPFV